MLITGETELGNLSFRLPPRTSRASLLTEKHFALKMISVIIERFSVEVMEEVSYSLVCAQC